MATKYKNANRAGMWCQDRSSGGKHLFSRNGYGLGYTAVSEADRPAEKVLDLPAGRQGGIPVGSAYFTNATLRQ
jgi:hypothetical protein